MTDSELPKGWRWAALSEICEINPRRPRNLAVGPETEVTFVPMSAVSDQFAAITGAVERPYQEVSRGYTYMEDGDVIFAKITPCMQNGKHAIVRDTRTGFALGSTEFHVLRPSEKLDARLLHSFLLRPEFLREAEHHFTGTAGQQRVPKEFMAATLFPLPPFDEQQRIVARLEEQMATAERARAAAQAQLTAIEAMPQALLREIFPRSPADGLPVGWRWAKLGEVCEMGSGGTPKRGNSSYFGGSIPWVIIGDLNDDVVTQTQQTLTQSGLNNSSAKLVPVGAVLIAMYGSIGKLGIAGVELTTNQAIAHAIPQPDVDPRWLFQFLRSDRERLATAGSGITQSNISQTVLKQWAVPIPPLDEQRRVLDDLDHRVAMLDRTRAAAQSQLDALDALPAAALRLAFAP